jgi:uncharacterized protein
MEISGLFIYPVKSLGGVSLESSEVGLKGLKYDRRYVLVDEKGVFVSQRTVAKMCLFQPTITEDGFEILNTQNNTRLNIPFELKNGETIKVKVWDDEIECIVAEEVINLWFSASLGMKLRLCYQPDDSTRKIDPRYSLTENDETSLSDGYPILIISEESIEEINRQCLEKIDIKRFRPNIIIKGISPFAEDDLGEFSINDVEMAGVKKCARCQVINIDFETAKSGKEPLRALSNFRKIDNKILVGNNIIVRNSGILHTGNLILKKEKI